MTKLLTDKEQYQAIVNDICFDNASVTKTTADKLQKLFNEQRTAFAEYVVEGDDDEMTNKMERNSGDC